MKTQKLARIIIILIASSVLVGVLIGKVVFSAYIQDATQGYITQPLQEASYIIGEYNSTYYYARNHTGYGTSANKGYEMLGDNASQIINWALGNLTTSRTWQEKVLLKGNFSTDSTILPSEYTIIELIGNVTLASGANCDLLRNKNYGVGDDYITITGGFWDGNKAGQTYGNGFNFSHTDHLYLRYVDVDNVKNTSLYLASSNGCWISDSRFVGADEHSIHWYIVADSWIERCSAGNSIKCGFLYQWGSGIHMNDMYFGGACTEYSAQVYLWNWKNSFMSNTLIDSSGRAGLVIAGTGDGHRSYNNKFSNTQVSRPLNSGYDAIRLEGDTQNNTFSNVYIGQKGEADDTDDTWRCGINETGNANWNIFSNVIARNCTTYFSLSGANSQLHHATADGVSYNIYSEASWIVFQDGSYTCMQSATTGTVTARSTNASQIINWALGNLTSGRTWQEAVLLKGNFTIDSPILVDDYTYLKLQGKVTLADASNCNMLQNADRVGASGTNKLITIQGGIWNCNRAGQSSGNGFDFYADASADSLYRIKVTGVTILEIKDIGVSIYRASGFELLDSYIGVFDYTSQGDSHGVYGDIISDSRFERLNIQSKGVNFYLRAGAKNFVDKIYCGGSTKDVESGTVDAQFCLMGVHDSFLSNINVDASYVDGIKVTHATAGVNNVWSNVMITVSLDNAETRTALLMTGAGVRNNTFHGLYIGKKSTPTYYRWDYGIKEEDGAGGNDYQGFIQDYKTSAFSLNSTSTIDLYGDKKTENSGSATNTTATTFVFNHGLAGTPTGVWASFNTTAITGWTWTATSTQITITVTGTLPESMTVYWMAIYKP